MRPLNSGSCHSHWWSGWASQSLRANPCPAQQPPTQTVGQQKRAAVWEARCDCRRWEGSCQTTKSNKLNHFIVPRAREQKWLLLWGPVLRPGRIFGCLGAWRTREVAVGVAGCLGAMRMVGVASSRHARHNAVKDERGQSTDDSGHLECAFQADECTLQANKCTDDFEKERKVAGI